MQDKQLKKENLKKERHKFLHLLERRMELPMIFFAMAWLVLLVVKLVSESKSVSIFFFVVWGILIFDFLIRFLIAPRKFYFLESNPLLVLSLLVPAFRVFRVSLVFKNKKRDSLRNTKFFFKKRWPE